MVRNMMAEYIEREAFLKDIKERYCLPCEEAGKDYNGCKCRACWVDDMCDEVIDAPAADVAPVVHGKWIATHDDFCSCSLCMYPIAVWAQKKYCPYCGARMME
jgi:hypothetical protein